MIESKNEFFDPAECPFEVIGFAEELVDADTNQVLGSRPLAMPTRKTGSEGMLTYLLTENTPLEKGWKKTPTVVKASPQKPRRVNGMIIILCGKTKGTK
jgi:hypothetical protein